MPLRFLPNARGRHSEHLRPQWPEVQPLVKKLERIPETVLWRRFWYELPDKHTEAWYVHQALEGTWPDAPAPREIPLVCRPNLDVYRGLAGLYTRRYGNLRRDGVDDVLSRAVADSPCSDDELWFPGAQVVPVHELAARFGDPQSQRIHCPAQRVRQRSAEASPPYWLIAVWRGEEQLTQLPAVYWNDASSM